MQHFRQPGFPQNVPQGHRPHGQARRGGIGPMMTDQRTSHLPAVPLSAQQQHERQQQQQAAIERAKLRARKPTDKTMPDGVEDCLISDGVQRYRELRDFERRLDATITRTRLDVVESVGRSVKRFKTMRIWITNSVENQKFQSGSTASNAFEFTNASDPSYRVKIEGRLLDDDDELEKDDEADGAKGAAEGDKMDTDAPGEDKGKGKEIEAKKQAPPLRLSHFFKRMVVEFDISKVRNGAEASVEWTKPERTPHNANDSALDFDELCFKRNGDENANITINLTRDETPARYQLSPALYDIVDEPVATHGDAVLALYEYIKLMGLQEDEEKRQFRCDELLKKVVGRDAGVIPELQNYVKPHLAQLPPVKLTYTIRVDEAFHNNPTATVYDVRVAIPDPLQARLTTFLQNPQYATMLQQSKTLDDQLAVIVQAVAELKAKHDFYKNFSVDPVNFLLTWLSSQKRDLEVIQGEAPRGGGEDATGDEWRRGGQDSVWASDNARESVQFMFTRRG